MKKILLLIISISLLTGCKEDKKIDEEIASVDINNFGFGITETKKCNNKEQKYYERDGIKVYLVCLDEISLKRENEEDITLKYYLKNTNKSIDAVMDDWILNITNVGILEDGGTKICKKDDYTIIKCNTKEGNKNIYIGNKTLEYQTNYCK